MVYTCVGKRVMGLRGEIVALLNDLHTLVENYIELHAIHTKIKRLLIPIIGKSFNYLFGTATESNLNTIHPAISRLTMSLRDTSCCR